MPLGGPPGIITSKPGNIDPKLGQIAALLYALAEMIKAPTWPKSGRRGPGVPRVEDPAFSALLQSMPLKGGLRRPASPVKASAAYLHQPSAAAVLPVFDLVSLSMTCPERVSAVLLKPVKPVTTFLITTPRGTQVPRGKMFRARKPQKR
jgi:hypothetical protein